MGLAKWQTERHQITGQGAVPCHAKYARVWGLQRCAYATLSKEEASEGVVMISLSGWWWWKFAQSEHAKAILLQQ